MCLCLVGLFEKPYRDGARIHSNSWGSSAAEYTMRAQQVDAFVYEHPDMLVLIAAGNSGEDGVFSVGSPATCKNCIAVGATQNDAAAYNFGRTFSQFKVAVPSNCETLQRHVITEAVPASFGGELVHIHRYCYTYIVIATHKFLLPRFQQCQQL